MHQDEHTGEHQQATVDHNVLDKLDEIFRRQEDLSAFYTAVRPDGFYSLPPLERCTTWTRAIVHECCELDNELAWKPWKNGPDIQANREERLMETADILHFLVQLALDQDFTAEDIYVAYVHKNEENRRRQSTDPHYKAAGKALLSPDTRQLP